MANKSIAEDYVTVAERVGAFYDRFPDGSIQSTLLELTDSRVTIRAEAYRSPDDARPGVGHASMTIPGSTAFTRGSELENTESSAWGRALAALGFETKRGIASADEIRSKGGTIPERARTAEPVAKAAPALDHAPRHSAAPGDVSDSLSLGEAMEIVRTRGIEAKLVSAKGRELYGQWQLKEMTGPQRAHVVASLLEDLEVPVAEEVLFDDGLDG